MKDEDDTFVAISARGMAADVDPTAILVRTIATRSTIHQASPNQKKSSPHADLHATVDLVGPAHLEAYFVAHVLKDGLLVGCLYMAVVTEATTWTVTTL